MTNTNYPVARNLIAISLRGLIWTISIALALGVLNYFYPINTNLLATGLVGLLMGPSYQVATLISLYKHNTRNYGWQIGEMVWGFVMWGALALSI